MKNLKYFFILLCLLSLISCGGKEKVSIIEEEDIDLQMVEAFKKGYEALEDGDVLFAAKKFNEAEILFPQSEWAPRSSLMAAYSYYIQDYYGDAIAELERFIKVYPLHVNLDYAYYLLAISYFEQIVDETKDVGAISNAKKTFEIILKRYPNTDYALDAEFKMGLINDILASKEMYIGRYYFEKKKWISAINRFRTVIDDYDTTIYTAEALHRLVEVHYTLGLVDEAEKYAVLLGYNYQSSSWYENSYSLFDKNYEKRRKQIEKASNKKKNTILKRLKSLFD